MATSRKAVIEARIAALEAEAAELERYGEDDYADGTVLTFKTNFGSEFGPTYSYAALKANGWWYLTGQEISGHTWDWLVSFWRESKTEKIKLVTKTRTILS